VIAEVNAKYKFLSKFILIPELSANSSDKYKISNFLLERYKITNTAKNPKKYSNKTGIPGGLENDPNIHNKTS